MTRRDRLVPTRDERSNAMNGECYSANTLLDPRQILDTIGADIGAIREFIAVALEDVDAGSRSLRAALARGELLMAASAAHALKGVVGNLGGRRAQEMAKRMEQLARSGDGGACSDLIEPFTGEIARLREALTAHDWSGGAAGGGSCAHG